LFWSKVNVCGYSHFVPWQDVLDSDRPYIKDDTIILEVVSSFNYYTVQANSVKFNFKLSMTIINIYIINMVYCSYGFGGLGVTCWPLVPKFAGSNLAEAVGFLERKNPQHVFLRRGSKAVGPMS